MFLHFFAFLFFCVTFVCIEAGAVDNLHTVHASSQEYPIEIIDLENQLNLLKAKRAKLVTNLLELSKKTKEISHTFPIYKKPMAKIPEPVKQENILNNTLLVHKNPAVEENTSCISAKICLSRQSMEIFKGDKQIYKWKISTAKKGYVTPIGQYTPYLLERMHYSKLYGNAPMPHSVFFNGNFAIHGTDAIHRLGKKASHGCVRLHPTNAKTFYTLISKYGKKNTTIDIEY
jgi:hypothetical protein